MSNSNQVAACGVLAYDTVVLTPAGRRRWLRSERVTFEVNNHVSFGLYQTTFEIAEVTVDGHWAALRRILSPPRHVARPTRSAARSPRR